MVFIKLFLILTALITVIGFVLYLLTGDLRYIAFIKKVLRFAAYLAAVLVLLFIAERYLLTGMKVIF